MYKKLFLTHFLHRTAPLPVLNLVDSDNVSKFDMVEREGVAKSPDKSNMIGTVLLMFQCVFIDREIIDITLTFLLLDKKNVLVYL